MMDTRTKIAAGLERAFAEKGFAAPSVGTLQKAAGVSLRTLYKYTPSREEMVYAALEHRHQRYLAHVFSELPESADEALKELLERIGTWMRFEATRGCLFHEAVASAPTDDKLIDLLQRHKSEIAERAARAARLAGREVELSLILEGLTQSWALYKSNAVESALKLGQALRQDAIPATAGAA